MADAIQKILGEDVVDIKVGISVRVNEFETISTEDFIMMTDGRAYAFGVCEFILEEVGQEVGPMVIVRKYDLVAERTRVFSCRATDELMLVVASDVVCALMWAGGADRVVSAIKPDFLQVRTG